LPDEVHGIYNYDRNIAKKLSGNWSENSIGMLLTSNSIVEAFVFGIARVFIYYVAPFPNIFIGDIQNYFVLASAVMNIIVFPFLLSGLIYVFKNNFKSILSPLVVLFLLSIIFIGMTNMIIHERYRVMVDTLLYATAYIGLSKGRKYNFIEYLIYLDIIAFISAIFFLLK
jgi:hypothetical protein